MAKIIVFSGHGDWALGNDHFVQVPAKCRMKFYTMNAKTLSDGWGGDIDRGIVAGLDPDQEAGAFQAIPDMRLYPPTGLNIRRPDSATWHVVELPGLVPVDERNLQVRIRNCVAEGMSLSELFKSLATAIREAGSVELLWAACRAVNLKSTGRDTYVNAKQR